MYREDDDDDRDHGPAGGEDEPEDGAPGRVDTAARVTCPYCAEQFELTLDPAGGGEQEYVEDCEICCRACRVHVIWDEDGAADVGLEEL